MIVGWPEKIITDNGKEFCNALQTELENQLGYRAVRCCPKNPRGNSFVEGRHRQMNALLKIAVKMYGMNWAKALKYINWSVNCRPMANTDLCPYELEYGYPPPSPGDLMYEVAEKEGLPTNLKKCLSPEDWVRQTKRNIENALQVRYQASKLVMVGNEMRENEQYYNMTVDEGDLVYVHRPIAKKGQTSRLLYQNMGPFEVVAPASPPNVHGFYNAYTLRNLATGAESPFGVKDIHPYLKKGEVAEMEAEKEEDEEAKGDDGELEVLMDEDFQPQTGDFLLFAGFQGVDYHLVRVTSIPNDEILKFNYFNTLSKGRLTGFAKVYTHESEKEILTNMYLNKPGYESEEHEVALDDLCQKVIVPEEYKFHGRKFFRLKEDDIADVLRYHVG
jgi:hypothetical protein